MKKLFTLLVFILSYSAISKPNNTLFENIANDVDSLMWDTVNEGEMQATVAENHGKPVMECKLTNYRETGKGIAKCEISFDVESYYTGETESCSQSCFLIHIYDKRSLRVIRGVRELEQSCIENLSPGCN